MPSGTVSRPINTLIFNVSMGDDFLRTIFQIYFSISENNCGNFKWFFFFWYLLRCWEFSGYEFTKFSSILMLGFSYLQKAEKNAYCASIREVLLWSKLTKLVTGLTNKITPLYILDCLKNEKGNYYLKKKKKKAQGVK